jgi:L-cystine transport system ATP-binding protein
MIIVTHEMAFARQVASRVFMENGEIVEQGPAEQIFGAAQQAEPGRFWRNCTIMPEANDEQ